MHCAVNAEIGVRMLCEISASGSISSNVLMMQIDGVTAPHALVETCCKSIGVVAVLFQKVRNRHHITVLDGSSDVCKLYDLPADLRRKTDRAPDDGLKRHRDKSLRSKNLEKIVVCGASRCVANANPVSFNAEKRHE